MPSKEAKMRISITILPSLNTWLEELSKKEGISKSSLIEMAVKLHLQAKLGSDAKKLAGLKLTDIQTEDEWLKIQSNDF